jgi:hypothetical protein
VSSQGRHLQLAVAIARPRQLAQIDEVAMRQVYAVEESRFHFARLKTMEAGERSTAGVFVRATFVVF